MLCGMCIALCTVLNAAFASLGTSCQFYIPLYICVLICPPPYAILCAAVSPLISAAVCAQPAAPLLPGETAECLIFVLLCLLSEKVPNSGKKGVDLSITLFCAVTLGRTGAGLINSAIFTDGSGAAAIWTAGATLRAIPDLIVLTGAAFGLKSLLEKNGTIQKNIPKNRRKSNSEIAY